MNVETESCKQDRVTITTAGVELADGYHVPIGGHVQHTDTEATGYLIGGVPSLALVMVDGKVSAWLWSAVRPVCAVHPDITPDPAPYEASRIDGAVERDLVFLPELIHYSGGIPDDAGLDDIHPDYTARLDEAARQLCAKHWPQVATITGAPVPA